MFLHFMHAITNDRDRVHSFVFGTRLTNITRHLRHRDVDVALERISEAVDDWSGGTRIGACLSHFNTHWSRRVLGQGALVLVISDGLDRDAGQGIEGEMERLHKSCRRLIWLNPLLRYEGFQPKSRGVRAMLPPRGRFSLGPQPRKSERADGGAEPAGETQGGGPGGDGRGADGMTNGDVEMDGFKDDERVLEQAAAWKTEGKGRRLGDGGGDLGLLAPARRQPTGDHRGTAPSSARSPAAASRARWCTRRAR